MNLDDETMKPEIDSGKMEKSYSLINAQHKTLTNNTRKNHNKLHETQIITN